MNDSVPIMVPGPRVFRYKQLLLLHPRPDFALRFGLERLGVEDRRRRRLTVRRVERGVLLERRETPEEFVQLFLELSVQRCRFAGFRCWPR